MRGFMIALIGARARVLLHDLIPLLRTRDPTRLDEPRGADPPHRRVHHHQHGRDGLYIGKIFSQVKGRPLFIVEEEVGAYAGKIDRIGLDDDRLERLA